MYVYMHVWYKHKYILDQLLGKLPAKSNLIDIYVCVLQLICVTCNF